MFLSRTARTHNASKSRLEASLGLEMGLRKMTMFNYIEQARKMQVEASAHAMIGFEVGVKCCTQARCA